MMNIYKFSNKTLTYERIKYKHLFTGLLVAFLIIASIGFTTAKIYVMTEKVPVVIDNTEIDELNLNSLNKALNKHNLKFKKIIMQQAVFESNYFKSNIYKQNNNFLGMRISTSRPTTHIGENLTFAVYKNWNDCLLDYALWQSCYTKKIESEEEYYQFLDEIYCTSNTSNEKKYSHHLKNIHLNVIP